MEEVLAEEVLLDPRFEILVRRGDDADVRLDRRMSADAVVVAIGEHAQQARLQFGRHIADLVEEERAAFGLLEAATTLRCRAGECAALVPEQLGFKQVARNRGSVDGDEGLVRARTMAMHGVRDKFLSGPRFAGNHHGRIRLAQSTDGAKNFLHRRRLAENLRNQLDLT